MAPTIALSIRQPWAWAILTLGKTHENRTWRTRHRGPLLIHAGKGLKGSDLADFLAHCGAHPELRARLEAAGGLNCDELRAQSGGIVGQVEITDCVQRADSPWFVGPFGFTLANPQALPFRPCGGQLGFFTPEPFRPPSAPKPAGTPDLFGFHLEA